MTTSEAVRLADCRARVKSQHGEDGVIAAIFEAIGIQSRTCVEFGAYDLNAFSNVYPLWTAGWRTVLIEGDSQRFAKLEQDFAANPAWVGLPLTLVKRYVEESGPNSLDNILAETGLPLDPDLICIDVDGTDFHVWRGLKRFRPRVVIVEYNPMIPVHIDLVGAGSGNDIGCSAFSLFRLGKEKGYSLVDCVGWNAVFVENKYASLFANVDDLDALFDPQWVRYAMQSYNGEVFFNAPLHLAWRPFKTDSNRIESSSVSIGKLGDDVPFLCRQIVKYYLRKLGLFKAAQKLRLISDF